MKGGLLIENVAKQQGARSLILKEIGETQDEVSHHVTLNITEYVVVSAVKKRLQLNYLLSYKDS